MLKRIEKLQIISLGILLGLSFIFSTKMVSNTISKNEIFVTGSACEYVKSDFGTLSINFSVRTATKQSSYAIIQSHLKIVEKYLKAKKIDNIEVLPPHGYYTYKRDSKTGVYTDERDLYNITQPIKISSNDVELIKEISTDIMGLISQGVDISVESPSYDYSKLSELKISLLEKASNDAKQRAISMLKPTGNTVGNIKSVKMGVFQITPVNSTNVSDMGINDTSTIDKKVTAVANVSFQIK